MARESLRCMRVSLSFSPTFQCGLFKRKRGKKRGYNIDEEQEEAEGEGGGEISEEGEEGEGEEKGEGEGGEEEGTMEEDVCHLLDPQIESN